MRFASIAKHRHIWPVSWLCQAPEVSRSGFHAWLLRPTSAREIHDARLARAIETSFKASDRTYAPARVWRDVLGERLACRLHRIERLMRNNALRAQLSRTSSCQITSKPTRTSISNRCAPSRRQPAHHPEQDPLLSISSRGRHPGWWLLFVLEAVRATAEWTTGQIKTIRDLLEQTAAQLRQSQPKIYSRKLVELIFVNPYCRISDLVDTGVAERQTAAVYLKAMVSEGLLEEVKIGRENLYINPALLALLPEPQR